MAEPEIRSERHFDGRVMRCFAERPATIDAMFREAVRRAPDKTALVHGARRISYAALEEDVDRLACALIRRGLKRGDRIALLTGNTVEFVVTVLAGASLGIIVVPLNHRQRAPETRYMLEQCSAAALIVDATFAEHLPDLSPLTDLRYVFALNGSVAGAEPFEVLLRQETAPVGAFVSTPVDEEDDFCILYTSGTTGKPKGARLSHLGVIHSVLHYETGLGLRPGDVAVLAVPASHVTGLVAILLTTIRMTGTTVLLDEFSVPDFLSAAVKERLNYTLMVPAIYNLLLLRADLSAVDLSCWRVGAFGGAPMPETTIDQLGSLLPTLTLQNVYGATETTSPATMMPAGEIERHLDSVGRPLPCTDMIVVDDLGQEVPGGTAGELLISGPMTIAGYWNRPDADAESFRDGYWRSGDIGLIDADGYVKLLDRKKDMVNRGGFKIYSVEVENVLAADPSVFECAVVGVPDPVLGERAIAFVVPATEIDEVSLRAHCAAQLSDYKVPDRIISLDAPLPRNANGKVLKHVLKAKITEA